MFGFGDAGADFESIVQIGLTVTIMVSICVYCSKSSGQRCQTGMPAALAPKKSAAADSDSCCTEEKVAENCGVSMPSRMAAALERKQAAAAAVAGNGTGGCGPSKASAPVKSKAHGPPPQLGAVLQLAKETGVSRKECREALAAHGDFNAAKASCAMAI